MTFIEILLAGFGAILIISALEDQPIIATFQNIVSGKAITIASAPTQTTSSTTGATPTTTNPPTVTL